MADKIQHRRGPLSQWNKYNPVLADGEMVLVATNEATPQNYDSKKVGDGIHRFSDLPLMGYECLQQTGNSVIYPMSQNAVTNQLNAVNTYIDKKADKTDVVNADSNLQAEINSIVDNLKPYADQYEFQMILGLNNDKPSNLQGSYVLNCDSDLVVQNKTYTCRYDNKTLAKTPGVWSSEVNDTIRFFANNVNSLIANNTQAAALILICPSKDRSTSINFVSSQIPYIDLSAAIGIGTFAAHDTIFENLTFQNNLHLGRVDTYDMHELKSLHIDNVQFLQVIGITDSPKFDTFTFYGQFDNLVVLNFFNSPLITLDTIMTVGYSWTSRVGKEAGYLRITTDIFNTMTQNQKNLFINKNISIEHQ